MFNGALKAYLESRHVFRFCARNRHLTNFTGSDRTGAPHGARCIRTVLTHTCTLFYEKFTLMHLRVGRPLQRSSTFANPVARTTLPTSTSNIKRARKMESKMGDAIYSRKHAMSKHDSVEIQFGVLYGIERERKAPKKGEQKGETTSRTGAESFVRHTRFASLPFFTPCNRMHRVTYKKYVNFVPYIEIFMQHAIRKYSRALKQKSATLICCLSCIERNRKLTFGSPCHYDVGNF